MHNINWEWIAALEGKKILNAYVPSRNGEAIGQSGVTIGTGVDLGQWSIDDIIRLGLSAALTNRIKPYLLIKGCEAIELLKSKPLTLQPSEVEELDRAIHTKIILTLINRYNRESPADFSTLPWQAQTVLASLAINLGPNLKRATATTWALAIKQDWARLARFLEKFPSKQKELTTRRKKEAYLLKEVRT